VQCIALSRLADDEVQATGYHEELLRTNFASSAPLLHGNFTSEEQNNDVVDTFVTEQAFKEILPRNVGFRAACLAFAAERTVGASLLTDFLHSQSVLLLHCIVLCFQHQQNSSLRTFRIVGGFSGGTSRILL
jgi:hypothetical protein